MPKYRITTADGRKFVITGDKPPSEQEIADAIASLAPAAKSSPDDGPFTRSTPAEGPSATGFLGNAIDDTMNVLGSLPEAGLQFIKHPIDTAMALPAGIADRARRITADIHPIEALDQAKQGNLGAALGNILPVGEAYQRPVSMAADIGGVASLVGGAKALYNAPKSIERAGLARRVDRYAPSKSGYRPSANAGAGHAAEPVQAIPGLERFGGMGVDDAPISVHAPNDAGAANAALGAEHAAVGAEEGYNASRSGSSAGFGNGGEDAIYSSLLEKLGGRGGPEAYERVPFPVASGDLQRSLPANADWTKPELGDFNIADLTATQDTFTPSVVEGHVKGGAPQRLTEVPGESFGRPNDSHAPVVLTDENGKPYLAGGTHRTIAAQRRGETSIQAVKYPHKSQGVAPQSPPMLESGGGAIMPDKVHFSIDPGDVEDVQAAGRDGWHAGATVGDRPATFEEVQQALKDAGLDHSQAWVEDAENGAYGVPIPEHAHKSLIDEGGFEGPFGGSGAEISPKVGGLEEQLTKDIASETPKASASPFSEDQPLRGWHAYEDDAARAAAPPAEKAQANTLHRETGEMDSRFNNLMDDEAGSLHVGALPQMMLREFIRQQMKNSLPTLGGPLKRTGRILSRAGVTGAKVANVGRLGMDDPR